MGFFYIFTYPCLFIEDTPFGSISVYDFSCVTRSWIFIIIIVVVIIVILIITIIIIIIMIIIIIIIITIIIVIIMIRKLS